MSTFDARAFTQTLLEAARNEIGNDEDLAKELSELEKDLEATLAALEMESDKRRANALGDDLVKFLPARKAAILSAARSRRSIYMAAALESALEIATQAALAVAKGFLGRA
jgi:hypothetical protein